ncbi:hypothetical protein HPB50_018729 [Hyalomma asiaticum]|uniref:Uncharacterized protein n=1 Tax=Hyalomma asiaticum TaxID=266040 RepID=A0ACB7S108_HYAAI|nr:hypothetical protein HPB50_018729 [Hyalomma asiaticum]
MDVHDADNLTASVTPLTSTRNSAAVATPSRLLLLPDTNPFAPLRELEEQNHIEGKSDNASNQARIIYTALYGEKRARGSLMPTPERQYTSMPRDSSHARRARQMLPASVRQQDEEDSWIPVTYRRKQQNRATDAPTPSSGSPGKYQHTVILRPEQPCRIMDEQFIRLHRVITRHISAHLNFSEEDPLPEFTVRYLGHSNQLAVDAAEPEVRNALLAIASLPVSGKDVPFHAYEAVSQNQIRGIIRNAGDMTSEELMSSLHCRKCKILQARPVGDKGTAMVTFEGNSLPYKVLYCRRSGTKRLLLDCGHDVNILWVPAHCGIPGNKKAHRLARAHLSTALARASDTHFPLLATPAELADPMADEHIAKQLRAAYLTAVGNPLSIPSIPSKVFTRQESVLLRRVQTETLLTPFLLNRFHSGGTPPPVSGLCSTCNCRADLNHLCWECPLYIPARLRALANINRGPLPSSLRTWASPDPTPPDRAIEFWRALLMFLQDPAAPPVGDRLRDSHKIQAAPT